MHTKKDFIDCLKNIVTHLKEHYTPGGAGIDCGSMGDSHGRNISVVEAFLRPLWGLAPLWHLTDECEDFNELYLKGIINGTNPDHEEYWGKIGDKDQRIVEMAAIGLSLILAPHKIWDPLSEKEKGNFYNWLSQINNVQTSVNNWKFFPVIVNLGFKNVGMPYNKEVVADCLDCIESYYIGNGWYSDGKTMQRDYYIPFAIHFYSLIYAKVMENDDKETSDKFKKRAETFAKDFIYWFDEMGRGLAFGRSLTYRFAQCCFWSACVFAGIEPFSMGVMKGIIVRNISYWLSLPIFDNGGVMSVGYGYSNIFMSEGYNGFGSPYWALKSFLILALPEDHAFYKAETLPLPKLNKLHIIPEAKMVIQRHSDYVVALTSGQWAWFDPEHNPEKYSKFAYSSKYAFSVPRSYWKIANAGADSMLVFVKDDMCFVRKKCDTHFIDENGVVTSEWSPFSGITVDTKLIPFENGHKRIHKIRCDSDYTVYDCGFATECDEGDIIGEGEKILINCAPNTNLLNPNTKIKAIKYELKKGEYEIITQVIYP